MRQLGTLILLAVLLYPACCLAQSGKLKIGVSLPLSGPLAEYGEAVRNGIDMASEADSSLASKINFIFDDNAYDPKKAVLSLQKLAEVDKVHLALIWGNEPALAVAPIAEARRLPTVVIAQYPKASLGKRYVMRFINSGEQYSQTLLTYLRREKIKKIAIIKSELSFFDMLIDGLVKGAREETIEVLETILPGEFDFKPSILKLRSRDFDILGVYLISPQVRQFYRQAADLQFKPRTFGATPFESKQVLADAWALMDGAVYTHNAVTPWFEQAYIQKYRNDMQLAYAANAFDFANLAGKLLGKIDKLSDGAAIIEAFRNSPPGSGASGDYRFVDSASSGMHFAFDIVIRKIQGGKSKEVFRSKYGRSEVK